MARTRIPTVADLRTRSADQTIVQHLAAIADARDSHEAELRSLGVFTRGREMTATEQRTFDAHEAEAGRLDQLEQSIRDSDEAQEIDRSQIIDGNASPFASISADGVLRYGAVARSPWTRAVGEVLRDAVGEGDRLTVRSGKLQVPPPLSLRADPLPAPDPTTLDNPLLKGRFPTYPTRLVDVLVNRTPLEGTNTYEYWRQTKREHNATVVADNAVKPTSKYAMEQEEDRVRVIAHLSEPLPIRLFDDNNELLEFLRLEMRDGVLDALEAQVISGSGSGENMRGLINVPDVFQQAWTTDLPTTLRKARTRLKVTGETPTAWVIHPEQGEAIDLLREGVDGAFLAGKGWSDGIMGALPVVESVSVEPNVAVLADWSLLQLIVREDNATLDIDAGGALFERNQCRLRSEGRYGNAVRRSTGFNIVDLDAPVTP